MMRTRRAKVRRNLDQTSAPPFEARELRAALKAFLDQKDPKTKIRLGSYRVGVYAFFDYDGEPIYVGQTCEGLRVRIGRHLTGQRSDAVAKNVLDPYEVAEVAIWPLPRYQKRPAAGQRDLDALEAAIFRKALRDSRFRAVLNEDAPTSSRRITIPPCHRGPIITEKIRELRGHPDTRIARRALTISRLAQVISERKVGPGLRRTLLTQAKRLEWLARRRVADTRAMLDSGEDDG